MMLRTVSSLKPDLMKNCTALREYSIFVSVVRQYTKEIPKDVDDRDAAAKDAISKAIDKCIEDGILSEFLTQHRTKVVEVCMWDYNEELHNKSLKQENYEDALRAAFNSMITNGYSKEEAIKVTETMKEQLIAVTKT